MDTLAKLKLRLKNREQVFMPSLPPEAAYAAKAYAGAGVDCMLIDAEHSPVGIETLRRALAACRAADLPAIVRVPDAFYAFISRTLDAGADGIMVPRVESLAQVEIAVSSSKFPPVGRKGCGGPGIFRPGESVSDFNRNRVLFIQIESPAGIDLLPDMLGRYGGQIDGVIVGPADLSIALGIPLEFENPLLADEIRRLIGVCRRYEKSCGMYLSDLGAAARWEREGMNVLWTSDAGQFAAAGAAEFVRRVRGLNPAAGGNRNG